MANEVNRAPHNTIPQEWAFHPTIGPFIRELINIVWQLRNRTGGDSDYIVEIQGDYVESEAPVNYDIRELKYDRDKYNAERQTQRKIMSMQSEIDSLKSQLNTVQRQNSAILAKLNQLIAEVETNA